MSDNCDNLPPDYPGYKGTPGFPNPFPADPTGTGGGGVGGTPPSGGSNVGGIGQVDDDANFLGAPGFDGLPNKDFIGLSQLEYLYEQAKFQQEYTSISAQEAQSLLEAKQNFFNKKRKAEACTPITKKYTSRKRRMCRCPVCHPLNRVKDKVSGKKYIKIPFTNFRIPRLTSLITSLIGISFDSNRRKGQLCGACNGRKYLMDVTDDSEAYSQVAQQMAAKAEDIMKAEAKLGLGGTRTTIIQGSDLLFVGLGFNNNQTHEIVPGGAIAPSMRGGKIPQQNAVPTNAVVGKQGGIAWPQQVGNYTIKCANKFNLLAGAGGITVATPGPLTFSAGMMKIIAPQLSLGSSTGPLTLEGDSVNVTGKAISITPTGGELFVKGNISNTGNITTQGHAHFESVSFAKGMCVGTAKPTAISNANPDVTITQPATWGGIQFKAVMAAILDLQNYYQHIVTDSTTSSFRLLSPKENLNISDRMTSIAKLSFPWEPLPTGFILPGMCNVIGIGNLGSPVFSTNPAPIPIHNFPHTHGLPEMMHSHEVVLPDMDYTANSCKALRSRVLNGAHESGVPADPTKDTLARLREALRISIEFAQNLITEGTKLAAKITRLS